jgi:TonB family protein
MKPGLPPQESGLSPSESAGADLKFLVTLEPWYRGSLRNLCDLFSTAAPPVLLLSPSSAPFSPDVFVRSRLPWRRFAESAILHGVAILALGVITRPGPQRPYPGASVVFPSSDVIRYELSEYLPTLDTGTPSNRPPEKGAPANAAQPIISVPPNSENPRQTIVSPPKLELNQDVPLPNMVAWADPEPRIPAAPAAAQLSDLRMTRLPPSVVAPPPEVVRSKVEPPPVLSQTVVAPAPEFRAMIRRNDPLVPQTAIVQPPPGIPSMRLAARSSVLNAASSVVPPSPGEESARVSSGRGRLIALNVHPAPPVGVAEVPNGNRRGSFAAGPDGKASAIGTPDVGRAPTTAPQAQTFGSASGKSIPGVPPGLLVGPYGKTALTSTPRGQADEAERGSGDPGLIENASAPRAVAAEIPADQQSEVERQVFGGRRSYGMTLNVPNLNSAGGSWIMHFSELEDGENKGDLVAPVAMRAVAPGYPLELMRENVEGTVTLSAVIASDGRVGQVTVLSGTNDRLNEYARSALLRWRFMPALRDGKPVALQAVVRIPFRARLKTGF